MVEIFNFLAYKEEKEARAEVKENARKEKPNFSDKINVGKLTELRCLVDKLISKISDNKFLEAYVEEHNIISSYSDAEIIGWINNFNASEVVDKPHFYSALIDEARDRELFPQHF